jgi:hypothetical protein
MIDPSGKAYTDPELQAITFVTDTFTQLKILNPAGGTWRLHATGVPGDKIRIDIVYNTDISIHFDVSPERAGYQQGDKVTVAASLFESEQPIPKEEYAGYEGILHIVDAKGAEETYSMTRSDGGFTCEYAMSDYGTVTVYAVISGEGYEEMSDKIALNIGNTSPKAQDDIEKTLYIFPGVGNEKTIDVKDGATDAEDEKLTYDVVSSSYMKDEYSIRGTELKLKGFSLSKGSFEIRATDSQGASCTFNVKIRVINLGIVGLIVFFVCALIVLGTALLTIRKQWHTRFYGTISVTFFDGMNTQKRSLMPVKGRVKLRRFDPPPSITYQALIPQDCYFQATGKNEIKFRSKKSFHTSGEKSMKKLAIGKYSTKLYDSPELTKGIDVQFESMLKQSDAGGRKKTGRRGWRNANRKRR